MKLYRIRRKDTEKFFLGLKYPWSEKYAHEGWSDTGAFYRDIDTISAWLKVLCSDWANERKNFKSSTWTSRRMAKTIGGFDREKLSLYEVVINDVTIIGEHVIKAEELLENKND